MEQLFEFMFGASRRINRAKYWKSILIYCFAGLLVGVILMTAAGLAAPLFIIALVVVLLPWLIWGFAIHTERLHDRNKSAWWLVVFFLAPGVVGHLADEPLFHGVAAIAARTHSGDESGWTGPTETKKGPAAVRPPGKNET
jgi:uncharacterized membrane protein YhaH (DUF805 family)